MILLSEKYFDDSHLTVEQKKTIRLLRRSFEMQRCVESGFHGRGKCSCYVSDGDDGYVLYYGD